ncbi:general odorant-binding protein 57b-like [Drosophila obscura]|uniref:general odorant-binding protein 57b-like n=1 Tax=Drosophila obscura TaxID=7282 RepID=UPI001BB257B9|nr:general odorant-binding protein 57b-like [Drosophila obscura]
MFPYTLLASAALISGLIIGLAQGRHPFSFFDVGLQDFDDCLRSNNLTYEEYETFESFENLESLLHEAQVALKYKCNIRCQLLRQPANAQWLDAGGRMDLQLMNATGVTAAMISRCMEDASPPDDEPCAYAFHLVMCAHKADHPIIDYDAAAEEQELYVDYVVDGDDYGLATTEESAE